MAHTNVASCVISIVGSYSNGLDVFKKLREQRQRKRRPKKNDMIDGEELRLSRSLRQGQEDIGREYQNNLYATGDQFAIGDVIAQTSLAEILLKLNTGLVGIIASFVKSDKKHIQLDYQSLTYISERSRVDTCCALRQLFLRLTQMKPQLSIAAQEGVESGSERSNRGSNAEGRKKRKNSSSSTKVRGPMLARVVIADSSKPSQIAIVKPGERRKKSSSSGSGSSQFTAPSDPCTTTSTPRRTPPPEYTLEDVMRPKAYRSNTSPEVAKPRRKHSAANITGPTLPLKGDALRATRSTPRLESTLPHRVEPLPPMPKTAPLPAMDVPPILPRRRKPTPTYYSIASDTTKLGEIPMHKWAVPYDFDQMSILNKEAYKSGWPLNQLESQEPRKKKFSIFRLFGRGVIDGSI